MPTTDEGLEAAYLALRREAEIMAGPRDALAQRSTVYHHLFRHSRGSHVFPLLAAHGALWGKGYFALGRKVGLALSLLDVHRPAQRRDRLQALAEFADAFRDINRRVCIEVYTAYHFTAEYGETEGAGRWIDPVLLDHLNRCHQARRRGRTLARPERAALFREFFCWEQRAVVGPSVDAAARAFSWSAIRTLAMRPCIRFSYIPRREALRFSDFADVAERIDKGLCAYEIAEREGLARVEDALVHYGILPINVLDVGEPLFQAFRERLLPSSGPGVAYV